MTFDKMMNIDRSVVEKAQLEALKLRFEESREKVQALKTLADKQEFDQIDSLTAVLPNR